MSDNLSQTGSGTSSRREFIKRSTAAVGAGLALSRTAHAAGSDQIKIALIGCGGRGTGAATQALGNTANPNVKLVAMADAFQDRIELCLKGIRSRIKDKNKIDVPPERMFTGLLGFQKAIDSDVDMVLICTPPGFRPMQFEAAVKAGKQIFMEKPLAVDAPGIRRIQAANEVAKKKGLAVAVGHHLRHETKHREVVQRLQDGLIGEIQYMRAYFNSSGVWTRPRKPEHTEMQYQVRNWYYFNWVCGDHIVEQHVHDLDVMNWIKGDSHPVEANGMGGRQVRISKKHGEIFDHHAVEFTYADGTKMFSFCRHIPGCWNSFSEHAHGTKGHASIQGHGRSEIVVDGQEKPLRWKRGADGHQVEHDDLFAAMLAGKAYNEVDYSVNATMTAILGRMATYSGKVVPWDEAIKSTVDLAPKSYAWDAEAPVKPGPDGIYPCAMPGITKAW